ncbi:hypothetical protein AG0111_0g6084 [Alternaria gaisen]|uniref:Uncharacterized protein n=1 Tax=Alternaria gaisen TaxID=167740 RepID=A0ACB6FMD6_9PLEO|nr:hypothetical protein AG0111_0g6084 [Alternaria gaisen]
MDAARSAATRNTRRDNGGSSWSAAGQDTRRNDDDTSWSAATLDRNTELAGGTEDPVAVALPVGSLQTLEGEAEAPGELDTLEDKIADDPVAELAETAEDGTELLAALDQADDPASGEVAGVEEPEAELAGGGTAKVPEDGAAWVPEDGSTGVPEGVEITIPEGGGAEIPEDGVAEFAGPEDAV